MEKNQYEETIIQIHHLETAEKYFVKISRVSLKYINIRFNK